MSSNTYKTNNLNETYAFGKALGELLHANDVLAMHGDLGAGKTTLTHGIAQGLGIKSPVSSPTFTLLFEHQAGTRGLALYHFDAYRLSDEAEWYDAGFMEYLDNGGVSIIEWADRIEAVLPARSIHMRIEPVEDHPDARYFQIEFPLVAERSLDSLRNFEL